MKKLISAATALTMAATMVSSIVPTVVSAADAKKGFSIEAYKEADSKYSTMGNDIKVSKDDIAAGDVVIPCAVYLDETTNDMLSLSVSFSVTSSSPDVKNVKITEIPLSKAYFDTKKSYTTPDGKTFETDIPVAFSGELSGRGVWSNGGSYQIATDPSQSVAGADYYYLGCSWTNGGRGYTYSSAKSTDHPFLVFNVTLPKGTSEGTYTFDYCKYNTDTSGQYDNPTPMVEVAGKRYTIANSNLDLKPMTITVGDAAPADTTTTTKPVVTTTTSKAPEAVTTTTAGNPGSSNAQIAFDMGDYKTVAGDDKLFVDVKVDTKGNKMTSADVIFNIQSPLEITEIDAASPATGSTVVTNLAILGANLICTDENSDPMIPDADSAIFQLTVNVPSSTPDGTYKIGMDKCLVYTNGGKQYTTEVINGNIVVGEGGTPATTTPTPVTTTSSKAPEAVTTTTVGNPGSSDAQIAFDMGDYKTFAGNDKLFVDVKVDTKGNKMTSADVIFNIQSPLEITEIDAASPATGSTV
ncbi:MAG: hypothetical protein MJ081_02755, partial [Ruminococcus sp.]|nr:hypothetical protein [Ruminococcus sp.]